MPSELSRSDLEGIQDGNRSYLAALRRVRRKLVRDRFGKIIETDYVAGLDQRIAQTQMAMANVRKELASLHHEENLRRE